MVELGPSGKKMSTYYWLRRPLRESGIGGILVSKDGLVIILHRSIEGKAISMWIFMKIWKNGWMIRICCAIKLEPRQSRSWGRQV